MLDTGIVRKKFKAAGFKLTPQRLAILASLEGDKSHPGPNEIYLRLKDEYLSLSLTTVYNTIEMLKEIGEIVELTLDRNRNRYDPDTSVHDHIICTNCNRIDDVPSMGKTPNIESIEGFKVTGVSNQYFGICQSCQV